MKLGDSGDERRHRTPDAHAFLALGGLFSFTVLLAGAILCAAQSRLKPEGKGGGPEKEGKTAAWKLPNSAATKPL